MAQDKFYRDNQIQAFANYLLSLSPEEFATIAFIAGFIMSKPLSTPQQNALGNFFTLFAQTFLTFNGQQVYINSNPHYTAGPCKRF